MEEFNIDHLHNPKKPLLPPLHLNSNTEIFDNVVLMEGWSSNIQGIMQLATEGLIDHNQQQPDQLPSSAFYNQIHKSNFGPNNISVFDTMPPFFSPNMILEPDMVVNSTSSSLSGSGFVKDNLKGADRQVQNYGSKKRKRVGEREKEKLREVVHVRAKRGQATDSHSLAERLRREKINEKLKCLQDLVPGCYETMGMAVMLDVIINYVRSLQNQIDFLSMKLSAASLYYDFNSSDAEAMEAIQRTTGYEAQLGMDKVVGEAYGGISHFQTTNWPTL